MAGASDGAANDESANNGEPAGALVGLVYLAKPTRCGEGRPRVLSVWE